MFAEEGAFDGDRVIHAGFPDATHGASLVWTEMGSEPSSCPTSASFLSMLIVADAALWVICRVSIELPDTNTTEPLRGVAFSFAE